MRFKKFRKKGMERSKVVKEITSSTQIQRVVYAGSRDSGIQQ